MTDENKGNGAKDLFQKIAANDTYRKIALAAGAAGIFLIVISGSLSGFGSQDKAKTSESSAAETVLTAEAYESQVEEKLTNLLSHSAGAGNVRVLVTVEQTAKKVYATEGKSSGQQSNESAESGAERQETAKSSETEYLLVKDANGAERALPVTEMQPVIRGVVVVCDGGGDPQVQKSITDAVTTALQVTSVRVCVVKSK
jgi:stage III sporulation protein AG